MSNQRVLTSMSALTLVLLKICPIRLQWVLLQYFNKRYAQSDFIECSYISLTEDMSNHTSMSALTLV